MKEMKKKYLIISLSVLVILLLFIVVAYNNSNGAKANKSQTNSTSQNDVELSNAKMSNTSAVDNELSTDFEAETANTLSASSTSLGEIDETIKTEINKVINKYYDMDLQKNKDIFNVDEKEISKAIESITLKREGIEAYEELTTYIRYGLMKDTFVVFSTYNMKFENIDTVAPGMSVLYIVRNDSGKFVIENDTKEDQELTNYIRELSIEEEIKSIIDEVNTKLINATEQDKDLNKFINKLQEISEE